MKRILLTFIFFYLILLPAFSQPTVEMADTMRSNGKIYVVVAVMVTILIGLLLYLIRIERKLRKLEKENMISAVISK